MKPIAPPTLLLSPSQVALPNPPPDVRDTPGMVVARAG